MKFNIIYRVKYKGGYCGDIEETIIANVLSFEEAERKLRGSIMNENIMVKDVVFMSWSEIIKPNPVQEFIDWKYKSKIV